MATNTVATAANKENLGFFPDYYDKVKKLISPNDINVFGKFRTDLERFQHVCNVNVLSENRVEIKRDFPGKSKENALKLKQIGNDAFRNKKWPEALMLYSKSYISMPAENETEIAILLANRSAALYHLLNYTDCLADIQRSIDKGYPKDMLYKIYERRAQCYLATKKYFEAVEAFKNAITSLDDCKLPLEKRTQIERNSIIMIKTLERDQLSKLPKPKTPTSSTNQKTKGFVSDAVVIDKSDEEGRFAKANRSIQVGEKILVEEPYACVLLEKYCKTHCQNCMKRTITPIACPCCADVIFCSESCFQTASTSYHKFECGILSTLWRSGISVNCQMALRAITIQDLNYFLDSFDKYSDDPPTDDLRKLRHTDYQRIYGLVRHADQRSESSFFQFSLLALFLHDCLKVAGYFKDDTTEQQRRIIGSLIMRNLQVFQYNTHEIFELHQAETTGEAKKTVFIGGGIYPTLALFNHSCDPGIVKYYNGTSVIVHAVKPILSGEVIAENYGPLFTQESQQERRAQMKDLYHFECNCVACTEDWPKFNEMRNDVIRIRCDAEQKCPNVIEIPLDCNDFMVRCIECGQFTNILKALKVMQDSVAIDKTAGRLYAAGDVEKALEKYIDKLKIMHEVVAPPFTDYSQCQQNIKDCFLHFGNSYLSSE